MRERATALTGTGSRRGLCARQRQRRRHWVPLGRPCAPTRKTNESHHEAERAFVAKRFARLRSEMHRNRGDSAITTSRRRHGPILGALIGHVDVTNAIRATPNPIMIRERRDFNGDSFPNLF